MADVKLRRLGRNGREVFPIGLGCMGMSGMYGEADETESLRTIHAAVERGVTLLDTGDFYGMGHNELLIGKALRQMGAATREKVILSVKFGAMRSAGGAWIGFDGRPAAVKNSLAYSLVRLGVSHVDIYRPARLDDSVPIEETVGAIADMVKQGYVRHVGLSEVGVETVRRAQSVTTICDVQLEYGLATRGMEAKVLPGLRELGVGTTAYGVLSRGLLTRSIPQQKGDFRRFLPRFTGSNLESNRELVKKLEDASLDRGVTPVQMAIAWALSRGEDIVPLVGARKVSQLDECLKALDFHLEPEDVVYLDSIFAPGEVQGTRYDKVAMVHLDSER